MYLTLAKTFAEYVKENWLTVGHNHRGWYATHDFGWLAGQMAKDGWQITATGETELRPDDLFLTYFAIARAATNE